MKILHIFTLSTTAESFFDGQFKYLSDAGHDIWLVSSSEEPSDFVRDKNKRRLLPGEPVKLFLYLSQRQRTDLSKIRYSSQHISVCRSQDNRCVKQFYAEKSL